jgi:purine-nucleoside phosphorylase
VEAVKPRVGIVLGSGLDRVVEGFQETDTIKFADVPGFGSTTVSGHQGLIAVGTWNAVPALVFHGRLHRYEGYPRETLLEPVKFADLCGVERLILTNAAGGIHPSLQAGSLMVLNGHLKLLGPQDWRPLAEARNGGSGVVRSPYSVRVIESALSFSRAQGYELLSGVYAALSGPSYETPAEIRALEACGVQAVGMSTAVEAELAANLGMEVAALSCVTNSAAGIGTHPVSHLDVLANARKAIPQLRSIIGHLVSA